MVLGRGVKVQCHFCDKFYALRKNGTFRVHQAEGVCADQGVVPVDPAYDGQLYKGDCAGTDQKPLPGAATQEGDGR